MLIECFIYCLGFSAVNPIYEATIALPRAKAIAVLKFNQKGDGDRIDKNLKNQIITMNNNEFGAVHFINAPYKSSDRTIGVRLRLQFKD